MIIGFGIAFLALIGFLAVDICYYPVLFFVIKFLAGHIMDFDRVRNNVAFQLVAIAFIVVIILLRKRAKLRLKDRFFTRAIPLLIAFLAFYSVIGILNGHALFQVAIDCYKYLEIVVYYVLFRLTSTNNYDLYRGLKFFAPMMIIIGVTEIFITSRGGVGLNLIMCLFPMIMMLAVYGYIKGLYLILFLSVLILAMCQTRTYIVGFFLSIAIFMFLLPRGKRDKILNHAILLGVAGCLIIGFFGGGFLSQTLSRFAELSEGFAESGGYRIYDYMEALHQFTDSPLWGKGFGYLKLTYIEKMGWMYWGDFVHCLYLEILFKVGLIGVIVLALDFGVFLKKLVQEMQYFKQANNFIFAVCCGGIVSFVSWAFVYTFAPLSTMGSMFMGVLISSIALSNFYDEMNFSSLKTKWNNVFVCH